MKIEIWSDVVCPFCYIGKRNFETAVERFTEHSFLDIEWKSFLLNPNAQPDPKMDSYTYLAQSKQKPLDWAIGVQQQITEMAAQSRLEYRFDILKPANSILAHRFIQMCKIIQKGAESEEALFAAHFTNGKNIQNIETIFEIGTDLGISAEKLNELLEADTYIPELQKDLYEAKQIGVSSVPFFLFDNKYAATGAQPVETFTAYLEKSFSEWENVHL